MVLWFLLLFFFFKQKTAYEMRISDWSSDVCSSDLASSRNTPTARSTRFFDVLMVCPLLEKCRRKNEVEYQHQQRAIDHGAGGGNRRALDGGFGMEAGVGCHQRTNQAKHRAFRSEEHTSELQSLMRISYAVFCLKKQKKRNN